MSLASKLSKFMEWTPEKKKIRNGKCDVMLQAMSRSNPYFKKMY